MRVKPVRLKRNKEIITLKIKDILSNKESLQEVLNQLSEALKDYLVVDASSIKWEMPVTDTVATQTKYKECTLRQWCTKMFQEKAMTLKHLAWILGITPEEVNDAINPAYAEPARVSHGYKYFTKEWEDKLKAKDAEIEEKNKRIDDLTDVISKKAKPYEKYPNSIYKQGRMVSSCQCNDKKRIAELESELVRVKQMYNNLVDTTTIMHIKIGQLESAHPEDEWWKLPDIPSNSTPYTPMNVAKFTTEQMSEAVKKFSNAPPPEIVAWCVVKSETK